MQATPLSVFSDLDCVLSAYPAECWPRGVESLGSAGGFSGALFWRLDTLRGPLCLRRWPDEYPGPERLSFIHSVLDHVHARGFTAIPVPIRTMAGESYCAVDGHLWELTAWLPGIADYLAKPTADKLAAAMSALAHWHLAAADYPRAGDIEGQSAGLQSRLAHLSRLRPDGLAQLSIDAETKAVKEPEWRELGGLATRLIAGFFRIAPAVAAKLAKAASIRVPLQPCIRDIWHDHVLFETNRVSGIIDFGAMRIETVAGDLARLLGSLAGDDLVAWQQGLAAYKAIRPLSDGEAALVPVFDESAMLLAGFNWLDWVAVSRRQFDDPAEVIRRLQTIVNRLEFLSNSYARGA
jgi:homoserine kinase type II